MIQYGEGWKLDGKEIEVFLIYFYTFLVRIIVSNSPFFFKELEHEENSAFDTRFISGRMYRKWDGS